MKYIPAVAMTPMTMKSASPRFLTGERSAMAPRRGEASAMMARVQVLTLAHAWVAAAPSRPAERATLAKKIGKTAVRMTACIAETAQSYIAQARSSGRCRPSDSRRGRFEGMHQAKDSFRKAHRPRCARGRPRHGEHEDPRRGTEESQCGLRARSHLETT